MATVHEATTKALKAMTEKAWQAQLVDLATLLGYRHFHPYDMRRSDSGWPDLTLVRAPPRPTRLIFAELKRQTGQPTAAQVGWLDDLTATGNETYLWRPADFHEIRAVLDGTIHPTQAATYWPNQRTNTITRMPAKDRALLQRGAA